MVCFDDCFDLLTLRDAMMPHFCSQLAEDDAKRKAKHEAKGLELQHFKNEALRHLEHLKKFEVSFGHSFLCVRALNAGILLW